ncbi:MAG: LacI family DNA-binding transcriptional regulator [Lutibacter sp.]
MSKPQKKNITLQDIAEATNISASTVSRALTNHPKINQKTKEKVWKVAKKLGYFPNLPVYMQKQKNNIVVFLVDDLSNLETHLFILAAQESLLKKGFQPLIKFVPNSLPNDKFLDLIKDIDVVGMINLLDEKKTIADFKVPIVSINKSDTGFSQVHVLRDIYNGAYLCANHLLHQGAKKLILIVGDSESSIYNDMEEGFKAAFTVNSESSFEILRSDLNKEILKQVFENIIKEKISFDGIVTCNNYVACQLHAFLQTKNIAIPDSLMLISFGNEPFINLISPGISSIEFSSENMGRIAADQLEEIINNEHVEHKFLIEPAKLIIRASSLKTFHDRLK